MTPSLRGVPPEVATQVLSDALTLLGVPTAAIDAVVPTAPRLLPLLAQLLERRSASEAMPPVERVELLDDGATASEALEQAVGRVPRR